MNGAGRRSFGARTGLLEILLLRAGRLVSKEQLVEHLCGWGEEVSTNAIEVYVHRLRKKLEAGGVRIAHRARPRLLPGKTGRRMAPERPQ